MLTDQQVEQFKGIYFTEFGIELSTSEALKRAIPLINAMRLITNNNYYNLYDKNRKKPRFNTGCQL